jgi:hypothetical protein
VSFYPFIFRVSFLMNEWFGILLRAYVFVNPLIHDSLGEKYSFMNLFSIIALRI